MKDLNRLCGNCVSIFAYAVSGAIGFQTGMHIWRKIEKTLK